MSFRAVLWALDQKLDRISKLILVAIASHANKDTGHCFPKIKTIARKASVSERTVHRYLPRLEEQKMLRVERKFKGKEPQPHSYWLNCGTGSASPAHPNNRAASKSVMTGGDTGGRTNDHYSNHHKEEPRPSSLPRKGPPAGGEVEQQQVRGIKQTVVSHKIPGMAAEQKIEQDTQCELARRLGSDGWEILICFPDEIPKLGIRLRSGAPIDRQLNEIRSRFYLLKESG
jgi:hypothetical protein